MNGSAFMLFSPNPPRTEDTTGAGRKGRSQSPATVDNYEPMFEKPLTPSDVGKLNRLVIPKHHAEKFFPLGGDKSLLLGFEDESGKSWKFRYSYWSSSQSYVLTKGWSRYVREKCLSAGDFVLFGRHRHRSDRDRDRFFIGWRGKNEAAQDSSGGAGIYHAHLYPTHHRTHHNTELDISSGGSDVVLATVPTGNPKRLRLFGVNLECQAAGSSDGSSSLSNQQQHYHSNQP